MATNMLSVIINGDPTGLLGAFATSGSAGDAWEKRIKTITQSSTVAMGAGFAALGGAAFALGTKFDDAYDKIRVGTGATGEALNGLQGDFKAVVSTVPATFEDASTAITTLNQKLGLSGEPLQSLSEQMLQLSKVTGTDLTGNLTAVTGVFQNFGVQAGDQGAKLDELFRASQASGIGVAELATQMQDSGVVLRAVGFDFTDSAALIASLGKAGIDASDVMPALAKSLASAAKDGKDASLVFSETYAAIQNAPDATTAAAAAMDVFGAKAGPKLAAAIREGKLSFDDMIGVVANGSETVTGAASDTEDFAEKFEVLKNKAFIALEPIATRVFGIISDGMSWITEHSNIAIPAIMGLVGAFTAWKIATMAQKVATELASAAQWVLNAAMDANPIMLVVIALAALAAGLVWAFNNVSWFHDAVITAWNGIKTASLWLWNNALKPTFTAIAGFITGTLVPAALTLWSWMQTAWNGITAAVMWAWNNVIQPIWTLIQWYISNVLIPEFELLWGIVTTAFNVIASIITWAWSNVIQPVWTAIQWTISNVLVPAFNIISTVVATVFTAIGAAISFAWNNVIQPIWAAIQWYIGNILVPTFEVIWTVVSSVFTAVVGAISGAWDLISGVFGSIIGGAIGMVQFFLGIPGALINLGSGIANAIFDGFKTAWNGVADFINDLIPNDIGFGPVSIDLPDNPIPKFHSGGVFRAEIPGGEGLALLRDGERILTPAQSMATSNYSTTTTNNGGITVNVNQPKASAYEIGQEVAWQWKVA